MSNFIVPVFMILFGTSGQYDFAEYFFDQRLDDIGSSITYPIYAYYQSNGNPVPTYPYNVHFKKIETNKVEYRWDGSLTSTYEVTSTTFLTHLEHSQHTATQPRFLKVGDEWPMDNPDLGPGTCTLEEHLPSFDLSRVTPFNLSTDVFSDVLHIHCETDSGNYDSEHYISKNIGEVFSDIVGDASVYLLPER